MEKMNKFIVLCAIVCAVSSSVYAQGQIKCQGEPQCFVEPCSTDPICAAVPGAVCHKGNCTCDEVWLYNGVKVDCNPQCQSDPQCIVDPCDGKQCPLYPNAKCEKIPCTCDHVFKDEKGNKLDCAPRCLSQPLCFRDPCEDEKCDAHPNAQCRTKECTCSPEWLEGGKVVDCDLPTTTIVPQVKCEKDGKFYLPGKYGPAGDGCNHCLCNNDGTWGGCTEIACQAGCVYNGAFYEEGKSFPAGDGCNECSCVNGQAACTDAVCNGCLGFPQCQEDACLKASCPWNKYAKCQTKECSCDAHFTDEEGNVVSCEEPKGGELCTQFLLDYQPFTTPDCRSCRCDAGRWLCHNLDPSECSRHCKGPDGEAIPVGGIAKALDGCNTCKCVDPNEASMQEKRQILPVEPYLSCTKVACPPVCETPVLCFHDPCDQHKCPAVDGEEGAVCKRAKCSCDAEWFHKDGTRVENCRKECVPGTKSKVGCSECFCMFDGLWACTDNLCEEQCPNGQQPAQCPTDCGVEVNPLTADKCDYNGDARCKYDRCDNCKKHWFKPYDGTSEEVIVEVKEKEVVKRQNEGDVMEKKYESVPIASGGNVTCTEPPVGEKCTEWQIRNAPFKKECKTCDCEDGLWKCHLTCSEPGTKCVENGVVYKVGDAVQRDCNTCRCMENGIVSQCTEKACLPNQCPNGEPIVNCLVNPCQNAKCEPHPKAICKANYCGGCNADFFSEEGKKVNCECRDGDVTKIACNDCTCVDNAWACTKKLCPQPECTEGDVWDDGCNTCVCKDGRKVCTEEVCGAVCKKGATKSDGCNTCTCGHLGEWLCTDAVCGECKLGATRFDGCNTCTCKDDNGKLREVCTELACPCKDADGVTHKAGEVWYGNSTCEECICENGQRVCKMKAGCGQQQHCLYGGKSIDIGTKFTASDGCNTCECGKGGFVSCTEIGCQNKGCFYYGERVDVGEGRVAADGCNTCWCGKDGAMSCTMRPCGGADQCKHGGELYKVGDTFNAGDGCNKCTCMQNGEVACTLKLCINSCQADGQVIGFGFEKRINCSTCKCTEDGLVCDKQECDRVFRIVTDCDKTDKECFNKIADAVNRGDDTDGVKIATNPDGKYVVTILSDKTKESEDEKTAKDLYNKIQASGVVAELDTGDVDEEGTPAWLIVVLVVMCIVVSLALIGLGAMLVMRRNNAVNNGTMTDGELRRHSKRRSQRNVSQRHSAMRRSVV